MGNKFKVDFALGVARQERITKGGNIKVSNFTIFTDTMGLKVFTREGVVFLTEENSEVL